MDSIGQANGKRAFHEIGNLQEQRDAGAKDVRDCESFYFLILLTCAVK